MPALKNARHERYAQGLAKGLTQDDAYKAAGYRPNRGNASTLASDQSISNRVAELQDRGAARTEITLAKLLEYADDIRKDAHEAGQYAAAVSAVKELGVLSGHRIEKRENTNRSLNELSDDELARIALGGGEDAAGETARPSKPH